jgi:hypothetical protein
MGGLVLYCFGHDDENASPESLTSVEGREGNNNNENDDGCGFLEFLREPFMLLGDI